MNTDPGTARLEFGMPTLVENATLRRNADLCARLGLRFIELNMNFPEYQADRLEDTDLLIGEADRAGIYYTVHLDENLNIADFNRLVTDAYLETVRRTVETSKKLLPLRDRYGDPSRPLTLNMHMNHGVHITLPDRKVLMYDRDRSRYLADCRRFRDLCGEWIGGAPIVIAVENTDGFRDYEREAVSLFLESPCFALTWDIGHSFASGEGDLPFIMNHSPRLAHFHIHGASQSPPRDHLALGDGENDVVARLRLAVTRRCRCVIETKTAAALERSAEWLRQRGFM